MCSIHSGRGVCDTSGVSARMTAFASPGRATSTGTLRPICVGSMSTWMMRAWGAKVEARPVTRSSNLMPTPRIRSASSTAMLAQYIPCIPSIPRFSGWPLGKLLRPSRVVITGMPLASANSCNSFDAPEASTPWPVIISGRSASFSSLAASCSPLRVSSSSSGIRGDVNSGNTESASSSCTSRGISISTGPGRPSCATMKASCMVSARSLADITMMLFLVQV